MAVWSSLGFKNATILSVARSAIISLKNESKAKGLNYIPMRSSHERTLPIRTSKFMFTRYKNLAHLYLMLGAIPLLSIITYVNIFIGPATLALIPEDYNPKPWEYYRHPITRFFVKYVVRSHQEIHERNLHSVFAINEITTMKALKLKIMDLMAQREDYQSWYFEKPFVKYGRKVREDAEKLSERQDTVGGWVK